MNIHIISLDDDVAALTLRSVLEYWNCTVTIHFIATADWREQSSLKSWICPPTPIYIDAAFAVAAVIG